MGAMSLVKYCEFPTAEQCIKIFFPQLETMVPTVTEKYYELKLI